MKFCTYCGQPLDPDTGTCSVCGETLTPLLHDNGFANALKRNLASNIMLLMCIAMTAVSLFSFFNVLNILITVSLWLTYSSAKSPNAMDLSGLKMMSVTITVTRVLVWITVGLFAIFGIVFLALSSNISDLIVDSIMNTAMNPSAFEAEEAYIAFTILFVFLGVFFIIFAAVYTVFNFFFYGSVSKSVKSVIASFERGKNLIVKTKPIMIWLIVLGVLVALEIPVMLGYLLFSIAIIEEEGFVLLFFIILLALLVFIATYILGAILANKIGKTKPESEIEAVIPV